MNEARRGTSTLASADSGGGPARRAVVRWAWRLFRREWRGQAQVLGLLIVAVAAATVGATAAYNLAPAEGNARLGSAGYALEFEGPDPRGLPGDIVAAEAWFGTIDVISRRFATIPGRFEPIELRAQAPDGPFSAPMLALVEGDYPIQPGDAAVTDDAAEALGADVGMTFDLDDTTWTVIGVVENPSDLSDEFVLTADAPTAPPETVTILVDASDELAQSFRAPSGTTATAAGRSANEGALAAVGVLVAATLVLLMVSLIAAAGFVVVAHRRLRQLGMLAAIGATERHLRLLLVANGALIGAIAAIAGAVIGLGTWVAIVPNLEPAVGHRIAADNVPWWLVATAMLLTLVMATAAAWWPARTVARIPVVSALSGRPPRPQPTARSAAWALPFIGAGAVCLVLAGDPLESWIGALLLVVGILTLIAGSLLLSPLAIRALAALSGRSPVAMRLALRDLVRYQARSGAALAAISLTLGIAAAIVITSSAALYTSAAEGNLAGTQLLVRMSEIGEARPIPERTPADVAELDGVVHQIAASLDEARVLPVDVAVATEEEGFGGLPAVVLTEKESDDLFRILTYLYVADPAFLEVYDADLEEISPATEVLTVEAGELWFQPVEDELVRNPERLVPSYTSLPGSFITPEALGRRGWEAARAGWLIDAAAPITDGQVARARELAAKAGLTVEARHDQADLLALRNGATAGGVLIALGILTMTVGLIRTEAAGDLRILTATGATGRIRRTLTATTAGGLALLGGLIGTGGAYLGLVAVFADDLATLVPVPVLELLLIGIGVPLVAAIGGWLVAGREPHVISRQPIT